jgi:hypothetical protein
VQSYGKRCNLQFYIFYFLLFPTFESTFLKLWPTDPLNFIGPCVIDFERNCPQKRFTTLTEFWNEIIQRSLNL